MLGTIQLSSWNIHGFKSKIVGNKLFDGDFLKEIENDDIVDILETHVHNENRQGIISKSLASVAMFVFMIGS